MKSVVSHLGMFLCLLALPLGGCGEETNSGPPEVSYGNDICIECNMILSDERFAAATVIEGPRGPTAMLFDDYNCQLNHAAKHPDLIVLQRWAHDHASRAWIPTSSAHFVHSEQIRSPMASRLAAFADAANAEAMASDLAGRVLTFEAIQAGTLVAEGTGDAMGCDNEECGDRTCCTADANDQQQSPKETP